VIADGHYCLYGWDDGAHRLDGSFEIKDGEITYEADQHFPDEDMTSLFPEGPISPGTEASIAKMLNKAGGYNFLVKQEGDQEPPETM